MYHVIRDNFIGVFFYNIIIVKFKVTYILQHLYQFEKLDFQTVL